jgi:hypothetical protein
MAKTKARPAGQKANGASDEDLKKINERLDAAATERDEAIQLAKDKHKRAVKIIEAEAKQVGVLVGPLKQARKVLALQEKLQAEADKIKGDEVELVEDMLKVLGGFADTPLGSAAIAAVDARKDELAKINEQEQAAGEAALAELSGGIH